MNTLTKIVIAIILSTLLHSCNFSVNLGNGKDGNGNVITVDRKLSEDFNGIKVSNGLDLEITQTNDVALQIEADENLHNLIMTDVENDILRIYTTENIRRASSKKVKLNIGDISIIKATSGSDVYSTNTIEANNLNITTTSGADMKLKINTLHLECKSTSGSDIKLSGKTDIIKAQATSGSDINASSLIANTANVKATSGADILVYASKKITAKATSGGDIKYSGNPEIVNASDNSSGKVRKQ